MPESEHNNSTKQGRNQKLRSHSGNILLSKHTSSILHQEVEILARDPLILSRFCESLTRSKTVSTPMNLVNNLKSLTEPNEKSPSKISTEPVIQNISRPLLLMSNDFGNGNTSSLSEPCSNVEASTFIPTLDHQLFSHKYNDLSKSKTKLHMALALLQNERKALYQTSMLLAGYPPESATDETSAEYLQFVFKACQEDYRILQELLIEYQRRKNHEDNSSLTPTSIPADLGANRDEIMYEQQQHLPTTMNFSNSYDGDHMDPIPVFHQNRVIHSLHEDFQRKHPVLDSNQRLGANFDVGSHSVYEPDIVKRKAYTQDDIGRSCRVDEYYVDSIDGIRGYSIHEEGHRTKIATFCIDENKHTLENVCGEVDVTYNNLENVQQINLTYDIVPHAVDLTFTFPSDGHSPKTGSRVVHSCTIAGDIFVKFSE